MGATSKIFLEMREREEHLRRAKENQLNEMENFVSAKDNSNNQLNNSKTNKTKWKQKNYQNSNLPNLKNL